MLTRCCTWLAESTEGLLANHARLHLMLKVEQFFACNSYHSSGCSQTMWRDARFVTMLELAEGCSCSPQLVQSFQAAASNQCCHIV
jgi:hypothetical protein